jgi:putative colanic acid biosynthesis acetyltransferase WcaF
MIRLDAYDKKSFLRGRPKWIEALWLVAQLLLIRSSVPGATHRRLILRLFGARIGKGVDIKPGVRVKFPWRLTIGDYSWIGEDVWIDNLANVTIGSHCCISQAAYLCTGSHDWATSNFGLIVKPIYIGDQAWIAARAVVAPGVSVGEGSVLGLSSVATRDLPPWSINIGSPAVTVKARLVNSRSNLSGTNIAKPGAAR